MEAAEEAHRQHEENPELQVRAEKERKLRKEKGGKEKKRWSVIGHLESRLGRHRCKVRVGP